MEFWERALVAGAVIAAAAVAAKLVDRRIARADRSPGALTRYRVLRRSIMTTIVFVGVLSALLVIPQVRAIAGGLLASSAVIGLVIGFASQRTLGNFVAGIMLALTQPLRLGDTVTVGDVEGEVEEINLIYTFIRTAENTRLVIPNEKLASDTIVNATIRSPEKFAKVTVQVPQSTDLAPLVELLRDEAGDPRAEAFVVSLEPAPTLTLRVPAPDLLSAERLERELRLRVHARLRAQGVLA